MKGQYLNIVNCLKITHFWKTYYFQNREMIPYFMEIRVFKRKSFFLWLTKHHLSVYVSGKVFIELWLEAIFVYKR